jgi:hypothetical protein
MRLNGLKLVGLLVLICAATACAPKRELSPTVLSGSADEFGIVPSKTLESPDDFSVLPVPTPGGSNATDVTPKADAIAALGGRLPVSGVDGGIVNHASRYGVDTEIRAELSKADAQFLKRKSNAPSFPWTSSKYERAYKRLALDPWAELKRLRALGVLVPTAPSND